MTITTYSHKRDYNKKFDAWDITFLEEVRKGISPLGGPTRDKDGYPLPVVVGETEDRYIVKQKPVGMGNEGGEWVYWKTAEAARAAARRWLDGRKEMTDEQKKEAEIDSIKAAIQKNRKEMERLHVEMTELERKLAALAP